MVVNWFSTRVAPNWFLSRVAPKKVPPRCGAKVVPSASGAGLVPKLRGTRTCGGAARSRPGGSWRPVSKVLGPGTVCETASAAKTNVLGSETVCETVSALWEAVDLSSCQLRDKKVSVTSPIPRFGRSMPVTLAGGGAPGRAVAQNGDWRCAVRPRRAPAVTAGLRSTSRRQAVGQTSLSVSGGKSGLELPR